jgi:hypothetical protein
VSTTGFTPEQTATCLFRDGHKCAMCGRRATTANHRANRGAGGHRGSNGLANACAICTDCNGLIESDAALADVARARGVKLSRYDDPTTVPYLSPLYAVPVLLDDLGGFTFVPTTAPVLPGSVPTMTAGRGKAPAS